VKEKTRKNEGFIYQLLLPHVNSQPTKVLLQERSHRSHVSELAIFGDIKPVKRLLVNNVESKEM
jgi:hypothetical protein